MPITAKQLRALVKSFPWDEWNKTLVPELEQVYRDLVVDAGTTVAGEHGVDFDQEDPFLQKHMTSYLGERITQLSRTSQKDVTRALQKALAGGEDLTPAKLQEQILGAVRKTFEDYEAFRALRIARSESAITYNHGNVLGGLQAGFKHFEVLDGTDDEECAAANGRVWSATKCLNNPIAHPNCLPTGTIVLAPNRQASFARWFEGQLVILETATGELFAGTTNHPVLTPQGWRPLQALRQGDDVIRSLSTEGIRAALDPDDRDGPTLIEQVATTPFVAPRGRVRTRCVPTSAEDFHGDGAGSDVHIERTCRLLKGDWQPGLAQPSGERSFVAVDVRLQALAALRAEYQRLFGIALAAARFERMGGYCQAVALGHGGVRAFQSVCLRERQSEFTHPLSCSRVIDAEFSSDVGRSGVTAIAEFLRGWASLWAARVAHAKATSRETAIQRRGPHANLGGELVTRLTGLVAPVQIREVRQLDFRGHVFNLETAQGWYVAGEAEVITRNCVRAFFPTDDEAEE